MNVDLEDLDVDGVFNLLVNYRIPPVVAQRFRGECAVMSVCVFGV